MLDQNLCSLMMTLPSCNTIDESVWYLKYDLGVEELGRRVHSTLEELGFENIFLERAELYVLERSHAVRFLRIS